MAVLVEQLLPVPLRAVPWSPAPFWLSHAALHVVIDRFDVALTLLLMAFCSARLCSQADRILNVWLQFFLFFIAGFKNSQHSGVLTTLFGCYMAGVTWNCYYLSTSLVYTIQLYTSLQSHFIQRYIGRVHVCLAVTCHLHFLQYNQDLSCCCSNTGVEQVPQIRVSRESWPWRRIFSHWSCGDSITSPIL